jgi:hypothetical protein
LNAGAPSPVPRTLDDIVREPDRHFEVAFDIAPNGRIAGWGYDRNRPPLVLANVPG